MDYLQYIEASDTAEVNVDVLNLVINGLPSIQKRLKSLLDKGLNVLNLVINGLPSIPISSWGNS